MSADIAALKAAVRDGLHEDNLVRMVELCGSPLIAQGEPRLPLFVLRACLQHLRYVKAETPVVASVVEAPDRSFADAASRVMDALSSRSDESELWRLLDGLVACALSLPDRYPSGGSASWRADPASHHERLTSPTRV